MGKMTLERACEVMKKLKHGGAEDWHPSRMGFEGFPVARSDSLTTWIGEGFAVVLAEHLERDSNSADAGAPAKTSLRSQVLALAELEPGWLDGEGEAYDPTRLAAVADVLDRLAAIGSGRVFPTPEGRVQVEWGEGRRDDSLEIDPATTAARLHLYDLDSGDTIVGEIAPEPLMDARVKPGAATRKVMEALARHQSEAIRTTTEYGVIVWPSRWGDRELTYADVAAALAECGMEAPR